jgi:DNA polymerase III subunit delta
MKIAPREQARFLQAAEASVAAVLFYGPDQGLVRERALELVARVAGDAGDPFRVVELGFAQLKDDPARLADEAAALSLTGGRRVLRLREAGDGLAEPLAKLLAGPPPAAFVVIEAGELGPRSTLRGFCEKSPAAAAIACYLDDEAALTSVVRDWLKQEGLGIDGEALDYLVANLGGDRGVTRQELGKLALYVGPQVGRPAKRVTLADVEAVIGDSSVLTLDDLVMALGDGDRPGLDRAYARALAEGTEEIAILRAAARHFLRLHQVAGAPDPRTAVKALRPPVFFKMEGRFLGQLRSWPGPRLGEAIERLNRAETQIKTGAQPKTAVAERALIEIATLTRGRG